MPFFIGVDGGGTKTKAVVCDHTGQVVATLFSGPSNFQQVGEQGIQNVCHNILLQLQSKKNISPDQIEGWALGLAGAGRREDQEAARRAVEALGFTKKVVVQSDAFITLYGAFAGAPGIIVISGTGSICFGLDQHGKLHRSGGWGYLLGDEGSGYFVGHQGVLAALRDFDGRGPEATALRCAIEEALELNSIDQIVRKIYIENSIQKEQIAQLAPLVFKLAQRGDKVAQEIVDQTAKELAALIRAVGHKMGFLRQTIQVAYAGSLFKQRDVLLPKIQKALERDFSEAVLIPPRFEPAIGGLLWFMKEKSQPDFDLIVKNLSKAAG